MATDFVAGCLGGMAGVVAGHPLDTVKVRIQTQCPKNPKYRGTFQCLRSIAVNEGTRGLYRGMSSPMVGVAAVNALTFGIQGNVRRLMRNPDSLSAQCRAGMIAGGCQAVIVSPMELVKSQLQVQSVTTGMSTRHYTSPLDCCRHIMAREGIRGLMRGYWVTVAREVPAFGLYFGTYELLTTGLVGDRRKSFLHMLLAGGAAGVSSWLFTYPIDVVKTRIQTDGMTGVQHYSGYIDCIRNTYRTEGWRAFMRGANSASIRAFPTNAVTFATVAIVLDLCQEHRAVEEPGLAMGDTVKQPTLLQRRRKQQHTAVPLPHAVTITQMTVQVETSDGGDAQRRRKATIRLDGQMGLSQLRRLLDREVAALQGQLITPCSQTGLFLSPFSGADQPVSSSGEVFPEPTVTVTEGDAAMETPLRSEPEEAGRQEDDEESDLELQLHREGAGRLVRRETTVVTKIVEYDVGEVDVGVSMSRMLECA